MPSDVSPRHADRSASRAHSPAQPAPARPRLAYLDITKGILVVLMVVYHSLNYTNQYHLAFRYLSFLPSSFILITGFLLSTVYFPRYRDGDRQLTPRLILRGVRLLILFTLLNVAAQYVRSPVYGKPVGIMAFADNWETIYLFGGGLIAAFEVLLPIAYLLLLAPALIAIASRRKWFLPVLAAGLVTGCSILDYRGESLVNLSFLSIGVVGMLVGRLCPDLSGLGRYLWVTLPIYVAYFPVGVAFGSLFIVQVTGALAGLALICVTSVRMGAAGWCQQRLIRLGQYSLVAYIVQIAILQGLSRIMGRPDPISAGSLSLFLITLVSMSLIIEMTEWCRRRSTGIDRAYKSIFA